MLGQPVDHIPFIARMDLWYSFHRNQGSLPPPYENASLWDIQRDLGIGIFGFGAWDTSFYRLVHHEVEITKKVDEGLTITEYHTPYGTLTCRDKMSDESATGEVDGMWRASSGSSDAEAHDFHRHRRNTPTVEGSSHNVGRTGICDVDRYLLK